MSPFPDGAASSSRSRGITECEMRSAVGVQWSCFPPKFQRCFQSPLCPEGPTTTEPDAASLAKRAGVQPGAVTKATAFLPIVPEENDVSLPGFMVPSVSRPQSSSLSTPGHGTITLRSGTVAAFVTRSMTDYSPPTHPPTPPTHLAASSYSRSNHLVCQGVRRVR